MPESEIGISILAKAPIPGFSKTRLIPLLGEDGAAKLQARFIERTFETARLADLGSITLWYTPRERADYFARYSGFAGIRLLPQEDEDLGCRMNRCIAERICESGELVIGTDCPCIQPADLREAARALSSRFDAVLFPAEDGGYGLIGMRTADLRIFSGVPWSSEDVLRTTRENLSRAGNCWGEPVSVWDVDTPADVRRLAASPAAGLLQDLYAVAPPHELPDPAVQPKQ